MTSELPDWFDVAFGIPLGVLRPLGVFRPLGVLYPLGVFIPDLSDLE